MSITPFVAPNSNNNPGVFQNGNANTGNGNTNRQRPFAGAFNPDGTPKPKAQLWINLGYDVVNANGETTFISIPVGIPVDTMEELPVRGQNVDFVKKITAGNELLRALINAGLKFEPGHEQTLNLVAKMRRVNSQLEVPAAENEYGIDVSTLFATEAAGE